MPKNSIQHSYYRIIKALYGNAITLAPDDVNKKVIAIVDKMLWQITKCHQNIRPIALIFQALAAYIAHKYPPEVQLLVGSKDWQTYLKEGDGINLIINMAKVLNIDIPKVQGLDYAALFQHGYHYYHLFDAFHDFYTVYLDYHKKDRYMMMCIANAKLHWRSPLQMALAKMDI